MKLYKNEASNHGEENEEIRKDRRVVATRKVRHWREGKEGEAGRKEVKR